MEALPRWLRRLSRLAHRRRLEREMDDEMRFHVEMEAAELVREGMPPAEARRQALLRFGGVERFKEEARDAWPLRGAERVLADLRYALRSLRRARGFTTAAVLALALGIGANAAVFGTVDSIAFRPLAARAPEELVALYGVQGEAGLLNFSWPAFQDFRRGAAAFSDLAAFTEGPVSLGGRTEPEIAWAVHASDNYFTLLGVKPALGAFFGPGDLDAPVVVLSHALWLRRFGGYPDVVGRTLPVNGTPFTVVGVAPAQFTGTRLFTYEPSVWLPAGMHANTIPGSAGLLARHDAARFILLGRLRPGVTPARARAGADAVARRLAAEHPELYRGLRTRLVSNRTPINPWLAPPARIAAAARMVLLGVALVLLIACADVAILLLARMTVRRREMAIRLSLGASRRRLVQQLLTESVALAALGAAAALPVAWLAMRGVQRLFPRLEYASTLRPAAGARVFAYAALLALGAAVVFGLAPALQACRRSPAPGLRGGEAGPGGRRPGLRELLVVAQVALSVLVLVSAGLFLRSLRQARSLDPGFAVDGALAFTLDPRLAPAYDSARSRLVYARVLGRLAELPGVRAVGRAASVPLDGNSAVVRVFADGAPADPERAPVAEYILSGPGWFRAIGTPLVAGRDFVAADTGARSEPVVVNEVLARRLWPGEPAVGKRLRLDSAAGPPLEVVGVARASKYRALGEAPRAAVWRDLDRAARSRSTVVVRAAGNEAALLPAVRAAVREADPALPLIGLGTLRERVSVAYAAVRSGASAALGFGVLAVLLAASGIYGVVSYDVTQRRREIAIRMALGAGRAAVVRLVVGRALRLALAGTVLGLLGAVAVPTGIERMLFGVSRTDPLALAASVVLFCAIAALAAFLPAQRAARLDPMRVLRLE
ncbi:MAG TPA: ABC transporter permease [Longimicrobium sp.]